MKSEVPPADNVGWTFISNHGQVLLALARAPSATLREIAGRVGITERAVQRIVADLEAARYLERVRHGRRNRYELFPDQPLRHPMTRHQEVGALIEVIIGARTAADADQLDQTGETDASGLPKARAGAGRASRKKPVKRARRPSARRGGGRSRRSSA
jgi:predicted DNA-binding transcriptional regulator YafY